ncbi:response regulator [Rhizobium sp. G21]|uniref:response regulator n=1 Tax=Rhizobium sp. G21 TaxID=2758439 RepID=UPI001600EE9D|nr:response regulator [Rhizobium sp. G21]MBB1251588.1 response regulator [Rhizobium sp. G21]
MENERPDPVVLLVDDEFLILDLLQEELHTAGFSVLAVGNGANAIKQAQEQTDRIRVIVTDIDLGRDLTGWDVARRAREANPAVAVIYMTGRSASDWAALGVPGSIMLQKPFVTAQLITAIATKMNEQDSSPSF